MWTYIYMPAYGYALFQYYVGIPSVTATPVRAFYRDTKSADGETGYTLQDCVDLVEYLNKIS